MKRQREDPRCGGERYITLSCKKLTEDEGGRVCSARDLTMDWTERADHPSMKDPPLINDLVNPSE